MQHAVTIAMTCMHICLYNNLSYLSCILCYLYMYLHICMLIGVEINIPGKGQKTIVAKLICGVLDLPAKAALLNCNQFNGKFGCPNCQHPGAMVHIYAYNFTS